MPNLRTCFHSPLTAFFLLTILAAALLTACKEDDDNQRPVPVITAITPDSAFIGDTVVITGSNFSADDLANIVTFNDADAYRLLAASPTQLRVIVPPGATTGPVTVLIDGPPSNAVNFTVRVLPPVVVPTITAIAPTSGFPGDTVTITGTNFTPADFTATPPKALVYFTINGENYPVTQVIAATETELRVVVPEGIAVGSGPIQLVLAGGTVLEGPAFTVATPAPTITSFTPTSGPEGTPVTITGTNFVVDDASAITVTLNGRNVTVSNRSETELRVTIPAGIEPGEYPFVVTVSTAGNQQGQMVTSAAKFAVTAPPVANKTVYYAQIDEIRRASISEQDGQIEVSDATLFSGFGEIRDLVIDPTSNEIYFSVPDNSRIMVADLNSNDAPKTLFDGEDGLVFPTGLALADGKLYWADQSLDVIMRGNVDGSGIEELFNFGFDSDSRFLDVEVGVSNGNVYWILPTGQVMRGKADGSGNPVEVFGTGDGLQLPTSLKIDEAAGKLYVSDSPTVFGNPVDDRILVGNLDGSGSLTALFETGDGMEGVVSIALDIEGEQIYWLNTDTDFDGKGNSLIRGSLNGEGDTQVLVDNLSAPGFGIVVVGE